MKLKIISNGIFMLTKVVNADTGETLNNQVRSIKWEAGVNQHDAIVTLELVNVPVELVGETEFVRVSEGES